MHKKYPKIHKTYQKASVLQIIMLILIILLLFIMCREAYKIYLSDAEIYQDESDVQLIRDAVISENVPIMKPSISDKKICTDENLLRIIDFHELSTINSDVYGWIYLPNTNVDYYIMQEQNPDEVYYLWRNIYKKKNSYGSVLTPALPDLGYDYMDMHLLIFGHHLKNKSQGFSNLKKFKDKSYASEHKYAYLYYPDRSERWTIWTAVYGLSTNMVYNIPYEEGSDSYQELLDDLSKKGYYSLSDKPDINEKTLVLSTCDGQSGTEKRIYTVYILDAVYQYDTQDYLEMEN